MRSNNYNRPYQRYVNRARWADALDSNNPGDALIQFFRRFHNGQNELSMAIDNIKIECFKELLKYCLETLHILSKYQHQQNYYFINQILASEQFFRQFAKEMNVMQNKYQQAQINAQQIENDKQFINYFLNFCQIYIQSQPPNLLSDYLYNLEQTLQRLNQITRAFGNELTYLNKFKYVDYNQKSDFSFGKNDSSFMSDSDFEEVKPQKTSQQIQQQVVSQIYLAPKQQQQQVVSKNTSLQSSNSFRQSEILLEIRPPNQGVSNNFPQVDQNPQQQMNYPPQSQQMNYPQPQQGSYAPQQQVSYAPQQQVNYPQPQQVNYPQQQQVNYPQSKQVNYPPQQQVNPPQQQVNPPQPPQQELPLKNYMLQLSQQNNQPQQAPQINYQPQSQQQYPYQPKQLSEQGSNRSIQVSIEEIGQQNKEAVSPVSPLQPEQREQNSNQIPQDNLSSISSTSSKQFLGDNQYAFLIQQRRQNAPQKLDMDQIQVSYQECPIEPSISEFKDHNKDSVFGGIIFPIPLQQPFKTTELFINNHFFILREAYIKNFRTAVSILKHSGFKEIGKQVVQNVFLYSNALVENILVTNRGLQFVVTMNIFDQRNRHIDWKRTKRLMPGSLLLLSSLNLSFMLFGTVVEKPEKDHKGRVAVVLQINELTTAEQLEYVNLLLSTETKLVAIENMIYYESFTYFLKCLKEADPKRMPFQDQIVFAKKDMPLPGYLDTPKIRREGIEYDIDLKFNLEQQKQIGMMRRINILREWPAVNQESLDSSQLKAIQAMLKNGIALIQGPPGTGKTYCGALGVRILLQNQFNWNKDYPKINKPILIVCQTNHALDQFLQHILTFCKKEDVVRIGGRCKVDDFQEILLQNNQQLRKIRFNWKEFLTLRDELDKRLRNLLNLIDNVNYQDVETINPNLAKLIVKQYLDTEGLDFNFELSNESRRKIIHMWLDSFIPKEEEAAEIVRIEQSTGNKLKNQQIIRGQYKKILKYNFQDLQNDMTLSQEAQRILDMDEDDNVDENDNVDSEEEENRKQNLFQIGDKSDLVSKLINDQRSFKRLLNRLGKNNENSYNIIMKDVFDDLNYKIWDVPQSKRNIISRQIFAEKFKIQFERLKMNVQRYDQFIQELKWTYIQRDLQFIQTKKIVGVTLTGCAKYADKLQNLNFNILIVEEAAEVLESNLVSVLSENINHLILIGDHQQLKPHLECYDLEVKYKANISLFERLIKNGTEYVQLQQQRRMKTKFADFIRLIYKNQYTDHYSIASQNQVQIKGLSHDLFFFNHTQLETVEQFSSSKSNNFEILMITKFVEYLIANKNKPHQITILCTYRKQALKFQRQVHKGVKIQTIDNYQGEENDIVILSLVRSNNYKQLGFVGIDNRVCVAFSRARIGLFIFGNFEFIEDCIDLEMQKPLDRRNHDISDIWLKIIELAMQKKVLLNYIPLECPSHKELQQIYNMQDWERAKYGCEKICDQMFPCGHSCTSKCHVSEHRVEDCREQCSKKLQCGHQCLGECRQQCPPCLVKIEKVIDGCGHKQQVYCSGQGQLRCYAQCERQLECGHNCLLKCYEDCKKMICCEQIEATLDRCKHKMKIKCSDLKYKDLLICKVDCKEPLICGHKCTGSCGKCFEKFHQPCTQKWEKILYCGHKCNSLCQLDCYQCKEQCQLECNCGDKCQHLCEKECRQCVQPCRLSCKHTKCTKKCFEICDRKPCNEKCERNLQCGCKCMGFCGEICPKICLNSTHHTKLAIKNVIHYQLECDCDVVIMEADELDEYINNIQPKQYIRCPNCQKPLWKSSRYQEKIKKFIIYYQEEKKNKIEKYQVSYEKLMILRELAGSRIGYIKDRRLKDQNSFLDNILKEININLRLLENQKHCSISYQHYICIKKQLELYQHTIKLQISNNNNRLFNQHKKCLIENYLLNEDFRDFYSDYQSWKLEQKLESLLLYQRAIQKYQDTQNLIFQNISYEIEDSHFFLEEDKKKNIIFQIEQQ